MKLLISHTWFLVAGGRNGFPSFSWSQKCEQIGCPVQEDARVEMYYSGWNRIFETANLFSDKPLPACAWCMYTCVYVCVCVCVFMFPCVSPDMQQPLL